MIFIKKLLIAGSIFSVGNMWVKARKLMGQLNRTAVTSVNPQSSDIKNPRVLKEKCVTGTGGPRKHISC